MANFNGICSASKGIELKLNLRNECKNENETKEIAFTSLNLRCSASNNAWQSIFNYHENIFYLASLDLSTEHRHRYIFADIISLTEPVSLYLLCSHDDFTSLTLKKGESCPQLQKSRLNPWF